MTKLLDQQCAITAESFRTLPAIIQVQRGEEVVSLPTTRQLVAWQTIGRLSIEAKKRLLKDVLRDEGLESCLPDEIETFMGATVMESLLVAVVANSIDDPALLAQEDANLDLFEARRLTVMQTY